MCSVRKLILLLAVALAVSASTIASDVEPSLCKGKKGFCVVRRSSSTSPDVDDKIEKRGIPARPGDIEVFGYYSSLLAIPTLLSVMGVVTNYNLEKSYFNSQINAQYYKQSRELLKAHAAQLIREQEQKFAKAGVTWQGMVYDKDGNANTGASLPSSKGTVLLPPQQQEQPGQEQTPKTPQQAEPSAPSTSPNAGSPTPEGQGSSGAEEPNRSSPTPEGQGSNGAEEPNWSANPANVIAGQGGSSEEGEGAAGGSTAAGSTGAATGGDGAKSESS